MRYLTKNITGSTELAIAICSEALQSSEDVHTDVTDAAFWTIKHNLRGEVATRLQNQLLRWSIIPEFSAHLSTEALMILMSFAASKAELEVRNETI